MAHNLGLSLWEVSKSSNERNALLMNQKPVNSIQKSSNLGLLMRNKNERKIELKANAFYIDGKPKLLRGGSFQWFRMPKEIWEDRIKRFKAAGYNTLDLYVSWRNHEPEEGKFDFKTFDIKYLLELAKKHDLYVCLRPGPYICNELDGGGIPAWVFTKTSKAIMDAEKNDNKMNLRTNEKDYIDAVKRYFDNLNKEIKPYLHTNGGPIIMYSIENEYDWFLMLKEFDKLSTYKGEKERPAHHEPDVKGYFENLRDMVRKSGIDVPISSCPGSGKIVGMGDVKDVIPMPNLYTGIGNAEYNSKAILQEMHSEQHGGIYKQYPGGVTETLRDANILRRLMLGGMKTVMQFNNIGFFQEGYQNSIIINAFLFDNVKDAAAIAKKMFKFDPQNASTLFFRPTIGLFPGLGDFYGSAIGPAGGLRDNFYNLRRANLFFESFQEHLGEAGEPSRSSANPNVKNQDRRVVVLSNKVGIKDPDTKNSLVNYWLPLKNDGALIGLHNDGQRDQKLLPGAVKAHDTSFPQYTSLTVPVEDGIIIDGNGKGLDRQYTMLLPFNFPIRENLNLKYSTSEVLCLKDFKKEKLLVVYGKEGSEGELQIEGKSIKLINKSDGIVIHEKNPEKLTVSYTHDKPKSLLLEEEGGNKTRVIVLETNMAGKTWFTESLYGPVMMSGVDFLDSDGAKQTLEFSSHTKSNKIFTYSQFPFEIPGIDRVNNFDKNTGISEFKIIKENPSRLIKSDISEGKIMDDIAEVNPNFDTKDWISLGDKPDHLEKHGIYHGHSWYKGEFQLNSDDLKKPGGIWITHAGDFEGIYINGQYLNTLLPIGTAIDSKSKDGAYRFNIPSNILKEGKNTITFKNEIWGHGNITFPRGYLDTVSLPYVGPVRMPFIKVGIPYMGYDTMKGLSGDAKFNDKPIVNWKLRKNLGGEINEYHKPGFNDRGWNIAKMPLNMKPGEVLWYRTTFNYNDLPDPAKWVSPLVLNLKGRNVKATIYLNGRLCGRWLSDDEMLKKGNWFQPSKNVWTDSSTDNFPIAMEALRKGRNFISIAFEDVSDNTKIDRPGFVQELGIKFAKEARTMSNDEIKKVPAVYQKIPCRIMATYK